jgi:hypothetical protein
MRQIGVVATNINPIDVCAVITNEVLGLDRAP